MPQKEAREKKEANINYGFKAINCDSWWTRWRRLLRNSRGTGRKS